MCTCGEHVLPSTICINNICRIDFPNWEGFNNGLSLNSYDGGFGALGNDNNAMSIGILFGEVGQFLCNVGNSGGLCWLHQYVRYISLIGRVLARLTAQSWDPAYAKASLSLPIR